MVVNSFIFYVSDVVGVLFVIFEMGVDRRVDDDIVVVFGVHGDIEKLMGF